MTSPIFKRTGLVRLATIKHVYPDSMTVGITFNNYIGDSSIRRGDDDIWTAQLPASYLSAGGGFIGGIVSEGTPVAVVQAEGGHHYFIVAFLAKDPSSKSTKLPNEIQKSANALNTLNSGDIIIQNNKNNFIKLSNNTTTIGGPIDSLILNSNKKLFINYFSNSYTITEAGREIFGSILRNRKEWTNFSPSLMTSDESFNSILKEIGMDPIADTTNSDYITAVKNPPRVEKRELIFEYEDLANIKSNDEESKYYLGSSTKNLTTISNRRDSRADTLSLSLVSPNYLIETIKGTVADTYGNILDINRNIIPIGKDNFSISKIKTAIKDQNINIYDEIKRLERKSIAYHFEINSRKESQKSGPPDVSISQSDDNYNYARDRSRFYLDIDKEGLFKLNIPASSKTGNIPLHTRYENYSTVYAKEHSEDANNPASNPNNATFNPEYKDILIEKYLNYGPIKLVDENGENAIPIDRFSTNGSPENIGHGTVYHDITKVARSSTKVQFYNPNEYVSTTILDPNSSGHITELKSIVSEEIVISGSEANAGGRSAFINMDGSLELNVGANNVDGQSMWLDTEGGIIASIGQDKQNEISLAASLDGSVFLEVGNNDLSDGEDNTKRKARVFDLKVADNVGNFTCFRIDKTGLSVSTQGRFVVYSSSDMMFRSAARITFDAENIIANGRSIIKDPGSGPIR